MNLSRVREKFSLARGDSLYLALSPPESNGNHTFLGDATFKRLPTTNWLGLLFANQDRGIFMDLASYGFFFFVRAKNFFFFHLTRFSVGFWCTSKYRFCPFVHGYKIVDISMVVDVIVAG